MNGVLRCAFALSLVGLTAFSLKAAEIVWTNVAGGNWSTAPNWSPNQVPAASDTAFITNSGVYTITLDANMTVSGLGVGGAEGGQTLIMNAPTLMVNGEISVGTNAVVSLFAGTLGASGSISVEGLLNIFGGSVGAGVNTGSWPNALTVRKSGQLFFGGNVSLNLRPILNAGHVRWTAGQISGFSSLTNLADGTFDILAPSSFLNGFGRIVNTGLVRKRAGAGSSVISVAFDNYGVVQVESGSLHLNGGGTHTNSFTIATGAYLLMYGGWDFSTSSRIVGSGNIELGGVDLSGNLDVGGVTIRGMVNFLAGSTVNASPIIIFGGTALFNTGRLVPLSTLVLDHGIMAGADSLAISGMLTMINGGTFNGTGAINANGGLSIDIATMTSGILNNMATGTIGALGCPSNAVINNAPGATLSVSFVGPGDIFARGTGRFNNAGVLRAVPSGAIKIPFDNSGTVEVQGGTRFSVAEGICSGSFQVATGAFLSFDPALGGSNMFVSGSRIAGGGSVIFAGAADMLGSVAVGGDLAITGGTVNFAGSYTNGQTLRVSGGTASFNTGNPITLRGLVFSGGTIAGSDPISVIGPMTWTGGTLKGPGLIEATAGLTMGGGTRFLDGRTLRNANAATWNGGFMFTGNGSIISNAPGAVFDIGFDGETFVGFGGSRTFVNAGLLRKVSGSGTATISDAVLNTGRIEARSGTLAFGNTFVQTVGATLLNGGDIAASGTLQIQGGTLSGDGTVTANIINSGQCAPGTATGLLRVNGDYVQTSAGQLNIELAATTFDRLQVSGAASLAGTLNISLFFHPALGQEFRILTFTSRSGDFNPYTFSTTSELTPRYDATGLTLLATNAALALLISRQPPNLLLSWPTNATGYMLQYSTNLPATSWIALPSTNNSQVVVPDGPRQYFRLAKP